MYFLKVPNFENMHRFTIIPTSNSDNIISQTNQNMMNEWMSNWCKLPLREKVRRQRYFVYIMFWEPGIVNYHFTKENLRFRKVKWLMQVVQLVKRRGMIQICESWPQSLWLTTTHCIISIP